MTSQELLTFLDIEATGIHEDSYPIEIGWVDTEGNESSFLIKPIPEWTHWDLKNPWYPPHSTLRSGNFY